MKFTHSLAIPEVVLIEQVNQPFRDHRGWFMETYRVAEFLAGIKGGEDDLAFVQGNVSMSSPWVLRGLHYQIKEPQGKLVRCLQGAIYDVAVDIRKGSPTFGRWVGMHLDDKEHRALWTPPGFAHGFLTLAQPSMVAYECSSYYNEASSRHISWDDPQIGITWPLKPGQTPVLSQKDMVRAPFEKATFTEYLPPRGNRR